MQKALGTTGSGVNCLEANKRVQRDHAMNASPQEPALPAAGRRTLLLQAGLPGLVGTWNALPVELGREWSTRRGWGSWEGAQPGGCCPNLSPNSPRVPRLLPQTVPKQPQGPEATLDQPPRATSRGAEPLKVPAGWNEPFNLLVLHKCPQSLAPELQKPVE